MGHIRKLEVFTPQLTAKEQAEEAVRGMIQWAGDDPDREGLLDTPKRVVKAYEEMFAGYSQDPKAILATTFGDTGGYDEMIALTDIPFFSHCEHHMVPFVGIAHVAYIPKNKVVGLSKLARLVDVYARRLQIQERMTTQIADTLFEVSKPLGCGVVVEATHMCMTMRGVSKEGASMKTSRLHGLFKEDGDVRKEFFDLIRG